MRKYIQYTGQNKNCKNQLTPHHLLDSDHPRVQQVLVQVHHRVDAHLPEELLLAADELGRQRGHGALLQQLALLGGVLALDGHCGLKKTLRQSNCPYGNTVHH